MNGFGNRLKGLREKQALTSEQMSEEIGFTKSVVWSYELEKKEPSVRHIIRIANFFNVSIDYLLNGVEVKHTLDLQKDTDMANYTLMVDNKKITKNEIDDAIAFIKAKRLLNDAKR